jgi:hypothetical protein
MKVQLVEPVGNGTFGGSFHALQFTRSAPTRILFLCLALQSLHGVSVPD